MSPHVSRHRRCFPFTTRAPSCEVLRRPSDLCIQYVCKGPQARCAGGLMANGTTARQIDEFAARGLSTGWLLVRGHWPIVLVCCRTRSCFSRPGREDGLTPAPSFFRRALTKNVVHLTCADATIRCRRASVIWPRLRVLRSAFVSTCLEFHRQFA